MLEQVDSSSKNENGVSRFVKSASDRESVSPKPVRTKEVEGHISDKWEVTPITPQSTPHTPLTPTAVTPAFNSTTLSSRKYGDHSDGVDDQQRVARSVVEERVAKFLESDAITMGRAQTPSTVNDHYQFEVTNPGTTTKKGVGGYERDAVRIPPTPESKSSESTRGRKEATVPSTRPKPVLDDVQFTLEESTDSLGVVNLEEQPPAESVGTHASVPTRSGLEPGLPPSYIKSPGHEHQQSNPSSHSTRSRVEEESIVAQLPSPASGMTFLLSRLGFLISQAYPKI